MKLTFAGLLKTRDGRTFGFENGSADEYRLSQLEGRWLQASQVCCYLGIPNPLGIGARAEVTEILIDRLPSVDGRAVYVPTDEDVERHEREVQ